MFHSYNIFSTRVVNIIQSEYKKANAEKNSRVEKNSPKQFTSTNMAHLVSHSPQHCGRRCSKVINIMKICTVKTLDGREGIICELMLLKLYRRQ